MSSPLNDAAATKSVADQPTVSVIAADKTAASTIDQSYEEVQAVHSDDSAHTGVSSSATASTAHESDSGSSAGGFVVVENEGVSRSVASPAPLPAINVTIEEEEKVRPPGIYVDKQVSSEFDGPTEIVTETITTTTVGEDGSVHKHVAKNIKRKEKVVRVIRRPSAASLHSVAAQEATTASTTSPSGHLAVAGADSVRHLEQEQSTAHAQSSSLDVPTSSSSELPAASIVANAPEIKVDIAESDKQRAPGVYVDKQVATEFDGPTEIIIETVTTTTVGEDGSVHKHVAKNIKRKEKVIRVVRRPSAASLHSVTAQEASAAAAAAGATSTTSASGHLAVAGAVEHHAHEQHSESGSSSISLVQHHGSASAQQEQEQYDETVSHQESTQTIEYSASDLPAEFQGLAPGVYVDTKTENSQEGPNVDIITTITTTITVYANGSVHKHILTHVKRVERIIRYITKPVLIVGAVTEQSSSMTSDSSLQSVAQASAAHLAVEAGVACSSDSQQQSTTLIEQSDASMSVEESQVQVVVASDAESLSASHGAIAVVDARAEQQDEQVEQVVSESESSQTIHLLASELTAELQALAAGVHVDTKTETSTDGPDVDVITTITTTTTVYPDGSVHKHIVTHIKRIQRIIRYITRPATAVPSITCDESSQLVSHETSQAMSVHEQTMTAPGSSGEAAVIEGIHVGAGACTLEIDSSAVTSQVQADCTTEQIATSAASSSTSFENNVATAGSCAVIAEQSESSTVATIEHEHVAIAGASSISVESCVAASTTAVTGVQIDAASETLTSQELEVTCQAQADEYVAEQVDVQVTSANACGSAVLSVQASSSTIVDQEQNQAEVVCATSSVALEQVVDEATTSEYVNVVSDVVTVSESATSVSNSAASSSAEVTSQIQLDECTNEQIAVCEASSSLHVEQCGATIVSTEVETCESQVTSQEVCADAVAITTEDVVDLVQQVELQATVDDSASYQVQSEAVCAAVVCEAGAAIDVATVTETVQAQGECIVEQQVQTLVSGSSSIAFDSQLTAAAQQTSDLVVTDVQAVSTETVSHQELQIEAEVAESCLSDEVTANAVSTEITAQVQDQVCVVQEQIVASSSSAASIQQLDVHDVAQSHEAIAVECTEQNVAVEESCAVTSQKSTIQSEHAAVAQVDVEQAQSADACIADTVSAVSFESGIVFSGEESQTFSSSSVAVVEEEQEAPVSSTAQSSSTCLDDATQDQVMAAALAAAAASSIAIGASVVLESSQLIQVNDGETQQQDQCVDLAVSPTQEASYAEEFHVCGHATTNQASESIVTSQVEQESHVITSAECGTTIASESVLEVEVEATVQSQVCESTSVSVSHSEQSSVLVEEVALGSQVQATVCESSASVQADQESYATVMAVAGATTAQVATEVCNVEAHAQTQQELTTVVTESHVHAESQLDQAAHIEVVVEAASGECVQAAHEVVQQAPESVSVDCEVTSQSEHVVTAASEQVQTQESCQIELEQADQVTLEQVAAVDAQITECTTTQVDSSFITNESTVTTQVNECDAQTSTDAAISVAAGVGLALAAGTLLAGDVQQDVSQSAFVDCEVTSQSQDEVVVSEQVQVQESHQVELQQIAAVNAQITDCATSQVDSVSLTEAAITTLASEAGAVSDTQVFEAQIVASDSEHAQGAVPVSHDAMAADSCLTSIQVQEQSESLVQQPTIDTHVQECIEVEQVTFEQVQVETQHQTSSITESVSQVDVVASEVAAESDDSDDHDVTLAVGAAAAVVAGAAIAVGVGAAAAVASSSSSSDEESGDEAGLAQGEIVDACQQDTTLIETTQVHEQHEHNEAVSGLFVGGAISVDSTHAHDSSSSSDEEAVGDNVQTGFIAIESANDSAAHVDVQTSETCATDVCVDTASVHEPSSSVSVNVDSTLVATIQEGHHDHQFETVTTQLETQDVSVQETPYSSTVIESSVATEVTESIDIAEQESSSSVGAAAVIAGAAVAVGIAAAVGSSSSSSDEESEDGTGLAQGETLETCQQDVTLVETVESQENLVHHQETASGLFVGGTVSVDVSHSHDSSSSSDEEAADDSVQIDAHAVSISTAAVVGHGLHESAESVEIATTHANSETHEACATATDVATTDVCVESVVAIESNSNVAVASNEAVTIVQDDHHAHQTETVTIQSEQTLVQTEVVQATHCSTAVNQAEVGDETLVTCMIEEAAATEISQQVEETIGQESAPGLDAAVIVGGATAALVGAAVVLGAASSGDSSDSGSDTELIVSDVHVSTTVSATTHELEVATEQASVSQSAIVVNTGEQQDCAAAVISHDSEAVSSSTQVEHKVDASVAINVAGSGHVTADLATSSSSDSEGEDIAQITSTSFASVHAVQEVIHEHEISTTESSHGTVTTAAAAVLGTAAAVACSDSGSDSETDAEHVSAVVDHPEEHVTTQVEETMCTQEIAIEHTHNETTTQAHAVDSDQDESAGLDIGGALAIAGAGIAVIGAGIVGAVASGDSSDSESDSEEHIHVEQTIEESKIEVIVDQTTSEVASATEVIDTHHAVVDHELTVSNSAELHAAQETSTCSSLSAAEIVVTGTLSSATAAVESGESTSSDSEHEIEVSVEHEINAATENNLVETVNKIDVTEQSTTLVTETSSEHSAEATAEAHETSISSSAIGIAVAGAGLVAAAGAGIIAAAVAGDSSSESEDEAECEQVTDVLTEVVQADSASKIEIAEQTESHVVIEASQEQVIHEHESTSSSSTFGLASAAAGAGADSAGIAVAVAAASGHSSDSESDAEDGPCVQETTTDASTKIEVVELSATEITTITEQSHHEHETVQQEASSNTSSSMFGAAALGGLALGGAAAMAGASALVSGNDSSSDSESDAEDKVQAVADVHVETTVVHSEAEHKVDAEVKTEEQQSSSFSKIGLGAGLAAAAGVGLGLAAVAGAAAVAVDAKHDSGSDSDREDVHEQQTAFTEVTTTTSAVDSFVDGKLGVSSTQSSSITVAQTEPVEASSSLNIGSATALAGGAALALGAISSSATLAAQSSVDTANEIRQRATKEATEAVEKVTDEIAEEIQEVEEQVRDKIDVAQNIASTAFSTGIVWAFIASLMDPTKPLPLLRIVHIMFAILITVFFLVAILTFGRSGNLYAWFLLLVNVGLWYSLRTLSASNKHIVQRVLESATDDKDGDDASPMTVAVRTVSAVTHTYFTTFATLVIQRTTSRSEVSHTELKYFRIAFLFVFALVTWFIVSWKWVILTTVFAALWTFRRSVSRVVAHRLAATAAARGFAGLDVQDLKLRVTVRLVHLSLMVLTFLFAVISMVTWSAYAWFLTVLMGLTWAYTLHLSVVVLRSDSTLEDFAALTDRRASEAVVSAATAVVGGATAEAAVVKESVAATVTETVMFKETVHEVQNVAGSISTVQSFVVRQEE
ncbi:hypothetical protein BCR44DRAFT_1274549 [Catenaria anguillulae PL171]|uniref:Uncharacterized protein n=1 Tax=Catenaria anguillulae PL171 TaxID=765915 RepID=A0A1Y2H9Q4_9FUNG|nr:hypothetical protein BCR44DRAFT_1274549 [Catenaria anguillulae PL171]